MSANGGRNENHDTGHESEEDKARLDPLHAEGCDKAADGEEALSNSQKVGTVGGRKRWLSLCDVVDEITSNSDLSTDVAELSSSSPEESILFAERLVNVSSAGGGLLGLLSHVGIGDFGNRREEEDNREEEDEAGDAEVDPLYGFERVAVLAVDVLEDNERGEDRCDDGTDGLERLSQVQPELAVLGRTASLVELVSGSIRV